MTTLGTTLVGAAALVAVALHGRSGRSVTRGTSPLQSRTKETSIRRALVALVGLILALAAATPASATKRCPPLPVQGTGSPTCKCAVQNYSTVPDTAINIVIYDSAGGLHSCNGLTLGPRMGTYCHVSILPGTTCGCVVSGEGSSTLASLSVTEPSTVGPQVSVACQ